MNVSVPIGGRVPGIPGTVVAIGGVGGIVVSRTDNNSIPNSRRMWTCTNCSYAYNRMWTERCEICETIRLQPTVTQPSLITLTKADNIMASSLTTTSTATTITNTNSATTPTTGMLSFRIFLSFSLLLLDYFRLIDNPVRAGGDQWTCKKCTLVNSVSDNACVVCGGSKLKSISSIEDMTLRKGEFWTCGQCTLKNSLATGVCSACKAVRSLPIESDRDRIMVAAIPEGLLINFLINKFNSLLCVFLYRAIAPFKYDA